MEEMWVRPLKGAAEAAERNARSIKEASDMSREYFVLVYLADGCKLINVLISRAPRRGCRHTAPAAHQVYSLSA